MLIIAIILFFVAVLTLWFGKPLIITYGSASSRRVILTPEQISAAAGRLTIGIASAFIVMALILAAIGEAGKLH